MPTFLTYYQSLDKETERGPLLNKLALAFGISYITVVQKIAKLKDGKDSFKKLEKECISNLTSIPVDELFPESAPANQ